VSTLYEQLEADRTLHGDEVADRRAAAWPRLLALFGAIHGGCEHPDLRLPACGGSLFDPAPHPWLVDARVTDRVVREMLDALLVLRHKGKAAERLSYSRLGVEQIGHVHEGLLEFSCRTVREPFVGMTGKAEPEVPLAELESVAAGGEVAQWLWSSCDATEAGAEVAGRPAVTAPASCAARGVRQRRRSGRSDSAVLGSAAQRPAQPAGSVLSPRSATGARPEATTRPGNWPRRSSSTPWLRCASPLARLRARSVVCGGLRGRLSCWR
jgi:hypothetical protein